MFESAPHRLEKFLLSQKNPKTKVGFGNSFLDASLGGIFKEDLIITTARTGGGKTELVTQIALAASRSGSRVHFFALEAHKAEIESRIFFKLLVGNFFKGKSPTNNHVPNYQDWLQQKQNDILDQYVEESKKQFIDSQKNLNTFYRGKDFDIDTFESCMAQIGDKTDLVILDHLHYFDFGDDENRAMKQTVKAIRQLQQFYLVPVVLVVHVRKTDKMSKSLLPDVEEIHGSSDIAKIATKIIATAPAKDVARPESHLFPTYFRILKNRTDGSRCRYVGLMAFDARHNAYDKEFVLGELKKGEQNFEEVNQYNLPNWAIKS